MLTLDTTAGYTDTDLATMNAEIDRRCRDHADTADQIGVDSDRWLSRHSDERREIEAAVLREFDNGEL